MDQVISDRVICICRFFIPKRDRLEDLFCQRIWNLECGNTGLLEQICIIVCLLMLEINIW